MIQSMTGYGQAGYNSAIGNFNIELKTLNAKYLDFTLKLPKEIADRESEIKQLLSKLLIRGKVNLIIDLDAGEDIKPTVSINKALFTHYFNELNALNNELGSQSNEIIKAILQFPQVVVYEELSGYIDWEKLKGSITSAADQCVKYRENEGESLKVKLIDYNENIRANLKRIGVEDPKRIENIKQRLNNNLKEFLSEDEIDKNRFEQELIYYLEKNDISEEKIRLDNHIDFFEESLKNDPSGKKLNFIAQEMGREINTIGSKANFSSIQRLVVSMKEDLEKIKEQVMNIL
ncbi:MAG TPA: YicC/YloC family endoribonuclease [Cyclobacteriaceae bacterium]